MTTRTVIGQYLNIDNTPVKGYLEFTPTSTVAQGYIIPVSTVRVSLDATGSFTVDLPVTDDPIAVPVGWKWSLEEKIPNGNHWYFDLPTSGTPLNLASVVVISDDSIPVYAVAGPIGPQGPVGPVNTSSVAKTGDTMTGQLYAPKVTISIAGTPQLVLNIPGVNAATIRETSTGPEIRNWNDTAYEVLSVATPTGAQHATTKSYVDLNNVNPNALINGGFDVWQRGTSLTATANTRVPVCDRWAVYSGAISSTVTQDSTVLTGSPSKYGLKITGASGVSVMNVSQRIEASEMANLVRTGKVTISGYIYNGLGITTIPIVGVDTPTVIDNFTTINNQVNVFASSGNHTAGAWKKFSHTFDVSAYTNMDKGAQFYIQFWSGDFGGAGRYCIFKDIKVEAGDIATAFTHIPYADELRACQRYYWRWVPGSAGYVHVCPAFCNTTNQIRINVPYPVPMRLDKIAGIASAITHFGVVNSADGVVVLNALGALGGYSTFTQGCMQAGVASGIVGGNATVFIANSNAAAYLEFSAEL